MTKSKHIKKRFNYYNLSPILNMWHSFFNRVVHDLKYFLRTKNRKALKDIIFWRDFKAHFAGTYSWIKEVLQPTYSELQQFDLLIHKAKVLVGDR